MLTTKKLSLVTLLAIGAIAPASALAEHRRDEPTWLRIGEVGTHTHDAEDYVPVNAGQRFERLALQATDGFVAIDRVQIQFQDGHSEFADVRRTLREGEGVVLDLPDRGQGIKMLVLDYGNHGPYWRARETAHLAVFGMADTDLRDDYRPARGPWRGRGRVIRDYRDYAPSYQAPTGYQAPVAYRAPSTVIRVSPLEVRAGFQIRVR